MLVTPSIKKSINHQSVLGLYPPCTNYQQTYLPYLVTSSLTIPTITRENSLANLSRINNNNQLASLLGQGRVRKPFQLRKCVLMCIYMYVMYLYLYLLFTFILSITSLVSVEVGALLRPGQFMNGRPALNIGVVEVSC